MTLEAKLRTLASRNASLQAFLGTPPAQEFRWYKPRAQHATFPYVTAFRVSTAYLYSHDGLAKLTYPRVQISCRDTNAENSDALADAVIAFLATADFASNDQFDSPATTPQQFPNYILNRRQQPEIALKQPPVYVTILDIRLANLEA